MRTVDPELRELRDVEVCEKRTFRAPQDAHRVRKTIKRYGGDNLSVYRCDDCGWWHLGHPLSTKAVTKGRNRKRATVRIR